MLYPFTILFLTIVSGEPETPPLQVISLVSKPPVIDGKLDDKAWPKIQPFSPFLISGTKTPAPIQTEVKACFDGGALYFAIVCLDPSSPKLKAKYDRRDGPLWEDDAIEIFINPDDRTYYQFILNSKGARCDLSYPKPSGGKTGLDWNAKPDWSVKTSVDKGQWVSEVRIPSEAIWPWKLPPQQGETFRLKMCRKIYSKTGDTRGDLLTSWNELPRKVFSGNDGWRLVALGGKNLIRQPDFSVWTARGRAAAYWRFEDRYPNGEKMGRWEVIEKPEEGIPFALRVQKTKTSAGQNPRLFATVPLRAGQRYRFSAKLKGRSTLNFTTTSKPWVAHNMSEFVPPAGGWTRFTEVSHEFTVGMSADGNRSFGHIYLWIDGKEPGEYLVASPSLVELKSDEPSSQSNLIPYHGMKSLAESNFGPKPMDLLRADDGTFENQRVIYRDTVTGVQIWKVTHFIRLDRLLSTGQKSWSADGRLFAYISFFHPDSNNLTLLSGDATSLIPVSDIGAPASWNPAGHSLYQLSDRVVEFDPISKRKTVLFELKKEHRLPGRNWLKYSPQLGKVMQYSWQFGKDAILRLWDLKTGSSIDIATRTSSAPEHKPKDWLYGARFAGGDRIIYGMNHKPHLSENNVPQSWYYDLKTRQYSSNPNNEDRPSHGATSPSGKIVGYFREGLCYRPPNGGKKVYIGGLGGDGHMAFLYQDRIAVSGDVSGEALVTMILPDTRNVIPISYSQNLFTGYYGSIIFVSMSPDATKLVFSSDMMGYRDLYWGIMRYPRPPRNVRARKTDDGIRIQWDKPRESAEVAGYLVYRSSESGHGYKRLNSQLVAGEFVDTEADASRNWYYVIRSLEHSSLASRCFSNEAIYQGGTRPSSVRFFGEAEHYDSQATPFRLALDRRAVNEAFMSIRRLQDESPAAEGKLSYRIRPSVKSEYRLWARVKRQAGKKSAVSLSARMNAKDLGRVEITGSDWHWIEFPKSIGLEPGETVIEFASKDDGLSFDRFLVSAGEQTRPEGKGSDIPKVLPAAPQSLSASDTGRFHIRLKWASAANPDFHHFQVYRSRGEGVEPKQEFLFGSPSAARLVDYSLRPGQKYAYVVTAVDNWGNESKPSATLEVTTKPLLKRVIREIGPAEVGASGLKPSNDRDASLYVYEVTDSKGGPVQIPFEVEAEGDYVIWIHGAARDSYYTRFDYQVDRGKRHSCMWMGRDFVEGQRHTERVQWDRLVAFRRDAGTRFSLSKGKHVLQLLPRRNAKCALLFDRIIVTNDLSYVPPGPRFFR